jgi:hypothetical protein
MALLGLEGALKHYYYYYYLSYCVRTRPVLASLRDGQSCAMLCGVV